MATGFDKISAYDLQVLNAVAETGSFHRAAKRLKVGQSAISRRIQSIEELMGISLFERSSSGASLTRAGRRFIRSSQKILAELEKALADAQSAAVARQGCLHIGSTLSFSNGSERRLIGAFRTRHPHVELKFFEATRQEMLTMLSHRDLDVVFTSCATIDENGDSVVLDYEPAFLATPLDGLLADRDRVSWSEVRRTPFLVSKRDAGPDILRLLIGKLASDETLPHIRQFQVSREALLVLVGCGLGVTIVGNHATGVEYPNVKFIPVGNSEERIPFSITWRPENDNPALRRFISLARIEAKRNGALS